MKYRPPRYLLRRHVLLREVEPAECFMEIGPGEFQLSTELAKRFQKGTLVEFHEEANALFETLVPEWAKGKLDLVVGDFTRLGTDSRFDCIVACEVLEHVEDDAAFVDKSLNLLRPGGQLVLSVPARMRYWSRHDEAVGHLRRYEKNPLHDLLASHGFQDIRIFSYGIPFIHLFRAARLLRQALLAGPGDSDNTDRTKHSGIHHLPATWNWLGWLVNPISFYPLCLFAELFEGTDASDGYVVIARKPAED